MQLDNHKIDLLLRFFENDEHSSWESIACKLIQSGKCVVPQYNGNIWSGGVGNFIKYNYELPDYFDCVEYQFNVDEFINSRFFQESLPGLINSVSQEVKSLKQQLEEKEEQLKSIKEFHNEF